MQAPSRNLRKRVPARLKTYAKPHAGTQSYAAGTLDTIRFSSKLRFSRNFRGIFSRISRNLETSRVCTRLYELTPIFKPNSSPVHHFHHHEVRDTTKIHGCAKNSTVKSDSGYARCIKKKTWGSQTCEILSLFQKALQQEACPLNHNQNDRKNI